LGPWKLCHHLKSKDHDESCHCGYRGGIWSGDGEFVVCEMGSSPDVDGDGFVQGHSTPQCPRDQQLFDAAFIAHARTDIPALLSALEAEKKRADEAEALVERLKREAVQHAQEARTANATIAEIYQAVTGGTGEPGNWQGAEPIKAELTRLREENERYREAARRAHVVVVNTPSSRIKELEAEVVRLRGVVEEADITLSHARTFVTTREKMHPTGVSLYDALLARISALKGNHQ